MLKPFKSMVLSLSLSGVVLCGSFSPVRAQNPYPLYTKKYCEWKKNHDLAFAREHYKTPETYKSAVFYINNSYQACMTKAAINDKKPVKDTSIYSPPPGGNKTGKTGKGARKAPPLRRSKA